MQPLLPLLQRVMVWWGVMVSLLQVVMLWWGVMVHRQPLSRSPQPLCLLCGVRYCMSGVLGTSLSVLAT